MITRLNMLIFMQPDLQKAVDFYTVLGGLNLKFNLKDRWAEFELGSLKIGLCPTQKPQPERRTGIVFEVDELKDFYEKHKKSLQFVGEPIEKVHGLMVSVKDPGNNIIDLYQPTPEKLKELIKAVKKQDKDSQDSGCCKADNSQIDTCCKA